MDNNIKSILSLLGILFLLIFFIEFLIDDEITYKCDENALISIEEQVTQCLQYNGDSGMNKSSCYDKAKKAFCDVVNDDD